MERAVLPCFQHQSALEPLFGPRWFLVKDTPVQEVGRVGIEGLSKAAVPLCRVPCRASAGPCGSTCARHQQRASASLPFGGSLSLCPRPFGSVLGGLGIDDAQGGRCLQACLPGSLGGYQGRGLSHCDAQSRPRRSTGLSTRIPSELAGGYGLNF